MDDRRAGANRARRWLRGVLAHPSRAGVSAVPADLLGERAHVDRLLEVAGESVGEQPSPDVGIPQRADCDDGDVGRSYFGPQRARDIGAFHVRQTQVEQDHVREPVSCELDGGSSARRLERPEPRAAEDVLRGWLAEHASNVHPVGRNGMFRYNNQDHSMFTAMLTVENIATGATHDVWEVNVEEEYHEEATSSVKEKFIADKAAGRAPGSHGTGRDAPVIKREVIDAHRPSVSAPRTDGDDAPTA